MRYIIDRKTNEHERYDGQNYDATKYRIVEADDHGWIKHKGRECPLPEDARCAVWIKGAARPFVVEHPQTQYWSELFSYRPILTEKVQEPDAEWDRKCEIAVQNALNPELTANKNRLLDRLKAAHAQAQTIPDLEAELREVLAGMGYDLVARSPFVEPEDCATAIAEPEDCCNQPAQCWEPCGDLGKDERYAGVVEPTNSTAVVAEPEPSIETPQQSAVPDKETLRKIFAEYHESAYNPKSEHYRFEHFYKALLKHSAQAQAVNQQLLEALSHGFINVVYTYGLNAAGEPYQEYKKLVDDAEAFLTAQETGK